MADYTISDIYQGGSSSLNPNYSSVFTGYRAPISTIGVSTDPRTANILKEFSDKIAPGEKVMELSLIDLGTPLDAIPKQHLQEIKRMAKLTGVEVTVHGPITDASGIGEQGNFNEQQRQIVERKLINSIERSHDLNPDGNIPVTFHTSNRLPGPIYNKIKGEGKKEEIVVEQLPVVNVSTGQVNVVKREVRHRPGEIYIDKITGKIEAMPVDKGQVRDVYRELEILNHSEWDRQLQQLIIPKEHSDKIFAETFPLIADNYSKLMGREMGYNDLPTDQQPAYLRFRNAESQLHDVQAHLHGLFESAYKSAENESNQEKKTRDKNQLIEIANNYNEGYKKTVNNPIAQSQLVQKFMDELRQIQPELYKPVEDYALQETAKTYGNVALASYKKYGKTAPLVNIENPPAGGGLSRGEDLKNLIVKSQENFVQQAIMSKDKGGLGMSESEAQAQAKKLIGATWDVGHINQLRRFGFSDKDIIKEAETVGKLVRHIHLSDNFGMDNTELPMGMGNVDFKEVMEALKKKGADVDKAKKIVEAAHWWQFQQTSPVGVSFEALGSPIYGGSYGSNVGPFWNQVAGLQQGYFGGYGATLPQINYETFGAGFSNLPTELGGQRQGGRGGRMSGTPME